MGCAHTFGLPIPGFELNLRARVRERLRQFAERGKKGTEFMKIKHVVRSDAAAKVEAKRFNGCDGIGDIGRG